MASEIANEDKSNAKTVVAHYNSISNEDGFDKRNSSRIFYQRNFNNWIKSIFLKEFTDKVRSRKFDNEITVLDVGCGKGGDLMKWQKSDISHIVCVDIAENAIEKCTERYKENIVGRNRHRSVFSAEFIVADCTRLHLQELYKKKDVMFDIVSVQFSFHYCFESLKQAEMMLINISEKLSSGGYFIGTTVDCFEVMKRLNASSDTSFGNEIYKIKFDQKDNLPLFGAKYHFSLEGVVDCPEYLVYFPALVELAKKYKLKLLYKKKLEDYFYENKDSYEGKNLLNRMSALETYPSMPPKDLLGKESDYQNVKRKFELIKSESNRDNVLVGTLSQAEWEVVSLYMVMAFVKE